MRFLRSASLIVSLAIAGCAVSEVQDFANVSPGKNRDGGGSADGGAPSPDGTTDEDVGAPPEDSGASSEDTKTPDDGGAIDSTILDGGKVDSGTPDIGTPDTGTPDTGTPDTGTPDTGMVDTGIVTEAGGPTTITFPASTDTNAIKAKPGYMWQKGDYVEGSRAAGPSITSISGTFEVTNNIEPSPCGYPFPLYTGQLDVNVTVNGTKVGSMKITSATPDSVPFTVTFPAISGSPYTIRYEAAANVSPYCGNVDVKFDVSKLTLK